MIPMARAAPFRNEHSGNFNLLFLGGAYKGRHGKGEDLL